MMIMRIRKALYAVLAAVLISGGTATATHLIDAYNASQAAARAQIRDFNDGWLDGVCEGNPSLARTAYGMTSCK